MLWCLMPHSAIFQLYRGGQFLLVEETGVPEENHQPVAIHWQTYHIMLYQVHLTWVGFKLTMLVVKDTICIGSYISNYHMIMTMMAPGWRKVFLIQCNLIFFKVHLILTQIHEQRDQWKITQINDVWTRTLQSTIVWK